MASGFRDLLAWLFAWKSSRRFTPAGGPYDVAAGEANATAAACGAVEHAGSVAAATFCTGAACGGVAQSQGIVGMISASNLLAGECNG